MDSFVLKSISRNRRLRICFKWSLWKFPVKLDQTSSVSPTHLLLRRRTCLDQTRLTSVSSASCLTAPPNSSASLASLLKQKPLGCERIEESNYISLKCKYFEGEITSSNTGKVRATHLIITEIQGQLGVSGLESLVLVEDCCSSCQGIKASIWFHDYNWSLRMLLWNHAPSWSRLKVLNAGDKKIQQKRRERKINQPLGPWTA